MRRSPSTSFVSLPIARLLLRVRALAIDLSMDLCRAFFNWCLSVSLISATSTRAYQTSSSCIPANSAIAPWYARTMASWMLRRCLRPRPLARAAISRLAARRLTSHSQGPGCVSSKSLRSKTMRRSGEANRPKFDTCASPHSCARRPESGVPARSVAITAAAPR